MAMYSSRWCDTHQTGYRGDRCPACWADELYEEELDGIDEDVDLVLDVEDEE